MDKHEKNDINSNTIFQSIQALFETAFYKMPTDIANKIYIKICDCLDIKQD